VVLGDSNSPFKTATEISPGMAEAVLAFLKKNSRGDIFYEGLAANALAVMQSYLDCRRRGMAEPPSPCGITFHERMVKEWEARHALPSA
jgi:hypothetical protein